MENLSYMTVEPLAPKKPGTLNYRCKNCGATCKKHVEDTSFIAKESLISAHGCDESTIGILDLIGIHLDKEPE